MKRLLYIFPNFFLPADRINENYCHKLVLPLSTWDLLHMKSQFHMYDNLQTHLRSTRMLFLSSHLKYVKYSKNVLASNISRYETYENVKEIFCEILESDCNFEIILFLFLVGQDTKWEGLTGAEAERAEADADLCM